ncbi:MAG: ParB N-terminal domain-containing protein, partial [Nitrospira sp.]|nr:ParB N-terminal domain-containing protein [Nitrospira sp.]
ETYSCAGAFDKLGILNPLIVQKDEEGRLHLVDGKKRIAYAKQNGMTLVDAVVLPDNTPVTDIIALILYDKREEIGSSVMNRVQFIRFAVSLNAPEEWMIASLCVLLRLKPHAETLQSCERINRLPKELKFFCHEKKFSLKQLLNLASYSDDLLGLLVEWNSPLQLTASTMDEIASNLNSFLRSQDRGTADLVNDAEIREILDSSMDPRDKTERLRQLIRTRQFPVLSEVNSRIEKAVSDLKLPKEIGIKWDRTLENKNAALSININDPKKWQGIIDTLGSKEVKDALKEILDEL